MDPKGIVLCIALSVGLAGSLSAADYVVVKGDSAFAIAQKAKITVDLLKRANPDVDWANLKSGTHLLVPDAYTVKPKDTLFSLAKAWGTDVAAVVALNDLPAGAPLKAGQVLLVPPSKAKGTSKPSDPKPVDPKPADPVVETKPAFWPVDKTPKPQGDRLKTVAFATTGEPFRSVSSGTVVFLGEFRGVGRVLIVQGPGKVSFTYGNFEESSVVFGQSVARGQVLGTTSSRSNQKLIFFAAQDSQPIDAFSAQR